MSEGTVPQSKPLTRTQWYVLIAAFLGWMFDGLEMGLFPIVGRPALQDLMQSPTGLLPSEAAVGEWYSYLVAAFLLGAAAGGLIFGWLGDRVGRVRTMALSIIIYAGFTGLCYFVEAPWQLAACRFLAAVGMGGEWALGVALIMECWPDRLRPFLAGVIGAAANVGFLTISLIPPMLGKSVEVDSWRWMMIVGAVPGALAFFILAMIPESEKWKEAVKTGASKPLREIFGKRLAKSTLLGIAFASVALIGTWGAVSGFLPVWADQLAGGDLVLTFEAKVRDDAAVPIKRVDVESTKNALVTEDGPGTSKEDPNRPDEKLKYKVARKHNLKEDAKPGKVFEYKIKVTNQGREPGKNVVLTDRFPDDVIPTGLLKQSSDPAADPANEELKKNVTYDPESHELVWTIAKLDNKDPFAKNWIQTVLSIGAIIGCFTGPLLGHWLGRRPAYFLLCASSLVLCGYLFRYVDTYNAWFLIVTGGVGLVTASFYGWLPLYLPELFPTRVRATGQGVSFNSGRILAAVGALTMGQLLLAFDGDYARACAVITLVYLVGMVLIWFAPETKGKPLPE